MKKIKLSIIFIIMFSILLSCNIVYANPNSSKGFAEYDDAMAEEESQKALEEQKKQQQSFEGKSTDNYLESLNIEGYDITPQFDKQTLDYVLVGKLHSKEINITAKPSNENAKIEGIGKITLEKEQKYCRIDVTAQTGTVRTYTIYFEEEAKEEYTKIPDENENIQAEETTAIPENEEKTILNKKNIIIILAIIILFFVILWLAKKKKKIRGKHY